MGVVRGEEGGGRSRGEGSVAARGRCCWVVLGDAYQFRLVEAWKRRRVLPFGSSKPLKPSSSAMREPTYLG